MTTQITKKRIDAFTARVSAIIAGAAALTLSIGVGTAFALTAIDDGVYDAIEIGLENEQLIVQAHQHDSENEFDPASVQFETDEADLDHSGYTIAEKDGPLSLGIAAEGDLWSELDDRGSSSPAITITITAFSGPGNLTVWKDSAGFASPIFATGASDLSTTITLEEPADPDEESFHQHYNWNFSAMGTYTVTVVANDSEGLVDPSAPVNYTFVVG
jgi:surface-anchored protein